MPIFSKPDPKDQMRKNDRELRQTNRGLGRDRRDLERAEKQLEQDIRKMAKEGNRAACAVLAKQLVNLRKQKTKSLQMGAKISGVQAQSKTMYSNVRMADAVKSTTSVMGEFNKQMDPQKLAKTMQDFEKANMQLDMGDEMISETLDSILDESGDDEEQDAIVNQVLDEIGIDIKDKLAKAPAAPQFEASSSKETTKMTDADLEAMLNNLKAS